MNQLSNVMEYKIECYIYTRTISTHAYVHGECIVNGRASIPPLWNCPLKRDKSELLELICPELVALAIAESVLTSVQP